MDSNSKKKRKGPYGLHKLSPSAKIPKTTKLRQAKAQHCELTKASLSKMPDNMLLKVNRDIMPDCNIGQSLTNVHSNDYQLQDGEDNECCYESALYDLSDLSEPVPLYANWQGDGEDNNLKAGSTEHQLQDTQDVCGEFSLQDDLPDSSEPVSLHSDREESDDEEENNLKTSSTEMKDHKSTATSVYPGCRLTVAASMLLVIQFVMRYNLSGDALTDLLTLIELHCVLPNMIATSRRAFRAFFRDAEMPFEFHYFCQQCSMYLGKNKTQRKCSKCNQISDDYFIVMPVVNQLIEILNKNLLDVLTYRLARNKTDPNAIEDVVDGCVYKERFDVTHFHGTSADRRANEIHVSLQMNTDGVALFKSSKFSIWPIYCTINELSPSIRYRRSTRIFSGLWFGNNKAVMDVFLAPFVNEMHSLYEKGTSLVQDGKSYLVRAIVLSGVFDAPARCAVQNMVQFNGNYGCPNCYSRGKSTRVSQKGNAHTYPFNTDNTDGYPTARTHGGTILSAYYAKRDRKNVCGVKGKSKLLGLPLFDIIRCVDIDYMHAVLLGVMKSLLHLWTDKNRKLEKWYIGGRTQLRELNIRLQSINPPNAISRLPRSLDELSNWKASEYRSFLLFYSVPVLYGILLPEYFEHYLLLVQAIAALLQSSISHEDIERARLRIVRFCCMFDVLYDDRFETSNLHSLLHICQKVKDLGPLWAHSCFFYEDINGDLRNLFHGTQQVQLQISFAVCAQFKIPRLVENLKPGTPEARFYYHLTTHHKIKRQLEFISHGIYAVHSLSAFVPQQDLIGKFRQLFFQNQPVQYYRFLRLLFHGRVIHAAMYKAATRRNSSVVKYLDSNNCVKYGVVIMFIKYVLPDKKMKYAAVLRQLVPESTCGLQNMDGKYMLCFNKNLGDTYIVDVDRLNELCVYIDLSVHKSVFVATLPNTFERD